MKRREFIAALGGAAAWPLAARAQPAGRVPLVVIWFGGIADPQGLRNVAAFKDTLRGLGWVDDRNVRIDVRWIGTSFGPDEMRTAAVDLAALKPDVIVTTGAPILRALHGQTRTIPIVFTLVTDPVGDGFVASLARPGGNITGFTIFEHSFAGKWLEMLKEVVPSMTRVAVMQNAGHPAWNAYLDAIGTIASGIGVEVTRAPVTNPADIEAALTAFAGAPNGGLVLLPSPIVTLHRQVIAEAALRRRLPSIYLARLYAESGGLMSYGPVISDHYRLAATYVDRILKGVKPGDLPVQAASRFEMVFNLKTAKALGIILLAGCASPVGIRTADPRTVQRYLTRSALTDDEPSDFSLNELRRYDLLETWEGDPQTAIAKLHVEAVKGGLPPEALFALSELSFLHAEKEEGQDEYGAAAVYAYALLFPEDGRGPLDPLDPRERVTADLYNRSLTLAFNRTEQGTLALNRSGALPLPFGHITVERAPDMLELDGYELFDLQPVAEIEVKGLRNRYRSTGIGAPLAAKTRALPGTVPVVPLGAAVRVPLTAVVQIDKPLAGIRAGDLRARINVFASLDTQTIEIDGRPVPLEAEPTAAFAAGLTDSKFWEKELGVFMGNAIGVRKESALGGLRPYKQGRIPVVFVHGTASSPARWADMVNDLLSDERLRERYAFWFFTYDSGNPIGYSGFQLRDALKQAVDRADPGGHDPCARDMVVLGHSQGGLLTKLTVIDSGNRFWASVSNKPFDDVNLDADDKTLLRNVVFVEPLPFVTEVVFLATPQQGSYLAGPEFVRRLAERFVRLPSDLVRVGASVVTQLPRGEGDLALSSIPTSIDNMSPGNRFIKTLASIPVAPGVRAHSIIAVEDDSPLDVAGDGVVKYQSAHFGPVDSELIVHSPHSGMQAEPATIEEMRRILLEHSARSACPVPK